MGFHKAITFFNDYTLIDHRTEQKGSGSSVFELSKRGGLCSFDLHIRVGHLIYTL